MLVLRLLLLPTLALSFLPAPCLLPRARNLHASGNEIDAPKPKDQSDLDALTLDQEIDLMTEKEMKKTKVRTAKRQSNPLMNWEEER